jgi:hypothetical protein
MRKLSKVTVAIGATAAVLGTAGVAYAYWTTTGTGTGAATSTTDVGTDKITLAQVGTLTGFYPGSTPQNVMVKATNPAAYSQKVGNVTVTVADSGTCLSGNWAIVDSADAFGILAATASSAAGGQAVATIQLTESGLNQDACKNVTPVLTFTSAPNA